MNKDDIAKVAASLAEIEETHPELHGLLARLAEELGASEIDPESGLAESAKDLVAAFEA